MRQLTGARIASGPNPSIEVRREEEWRGGEGLIKLINGADVAGVLTSAAAPASAFNTGQLISIDL